VGRLVESYSETGANVLKEGTSFGRSQPDASHAGGTTNSDTPQFRQTVTLGLGFMGGALMVLDPFT
jgi:hypothetical protein